MRGPAPRRGRLCTAAVKRGVGEAVAASIPVEAVAPPWIRSKRVAMSTAADMNTWRLVTEYRLGILLYNALEAAEQISARTAARSIGPDADCGFCEALLAIIEVSYARSSSVDSSFGVFRAMAKRSPRQAIQTFLSTMVQLLARDELARRQLSCMLGEPLEWLREVS